MFDTVFILDDTGLIDESMNSKDLHGTKRWEAAKQALKHVGKIATQKDLNGVDLRSLKADDVADNITDFDGLVDKLDSAELDEFGGGTFFQEQLEEIIHPRLIAYTEFRQQSEVYNAETRRRVHHRKANAHLTRPKEPKKLNLIVITDGSADDEPEVESYITEVARELDRLGAKCSQIGIQFVQVGDDPNASEFLRRLDDDLKHNTKPPIRDIVDTTPFKSANAQDSGSFLQLLEKVLLGGVTKDIDDRENELMTLQPLELR